MKKIILTLTLALSASLFATVPGAFAQESYNGTTIAVPADWILSQMKTFSGSIPSRGWVFERGEEEIFVSALTTDGFIEGLTESQNMSTMVKRYTESFIIGWGGTPDMTTEKVIPSATFCDGEPGYHVRVKFGERQFVYYACMKKREDNRRIATVVFWQNTDSEEEAAERMIPFIRNISWESRQSPAPLDI